jgi:hypothetical protein
MLIHRLPTCRLVGPRRGWRACVAHGATAIQNLVVNAMHRGGEMFVIDRGGTAALMMVAPSAKGYAATADEVIE